MPAPVGFAILLLATLAWLGLLAVPFLQIQDWLLKKTAFTVVTFLGALFSQGAPVAAVVLAGGLIFAPAFELVATWVAWASARRDREPPGWVSGRDKVRHWSMLNVFLVALLIFLAEGESLMTVAPRNGLIFLSVLLAIDISLYFVSRRGEGAKGSAADPEPADRAG